MLLLTAAIVVSGSPIAHAANCSNHVDHVMPADDGHHAHHAHMAASSDQDAGSIQEHADKGPHDVATPCKCLNCSSACAAYVAPLAFNTSVIRQAEETAYAVREAFRHDVPPSIDPGIPIAV